MIPDIWDSFKVTNASSKDVLPSATCVCADSIVAIPVAICVLLSLNFEIAAGMSL